MSPDSFLGQIEEWRREQGLNLRDQIKSLVPKPLGHLSPERTREFSLSPEPVERRLLKATLYFCRAYHTCFAHKVWSTTNSFLGAFRKSVPGRAHETTLLRVEMEIAQKPTFQSSIFLFK